VTATEQAGTSVPFVAAPLGSLMTFSTRFLLALIRATATPGSATHTFAPRAATVRGVSAAIRIFLTTWRDFGSIRTSKCDCGTVTQTAPATAATSSGGPLSRIRSSARNGADVNRHTHGDPGPTTHTAPAPAATADGCTLPTDRCWVASPFAGAIFHSFPSGPVTHTAPWPTATAVGFPPR
jgi:hypothetical protein